ncbi:MAG: radical SAM protein [Sandaracinaceae bacterium]
MSEREPQVRPPVGAIPERPSELVRGPAGGAMSYCVWEITLKCDLGCRHCGSRAGKARPDELSTEECLDIVRQLDEIGVREVTLIGGEAYLRDDWDIIAKALVDRGLRVGITTGGRNFDADRVKRAVDAGISTISVSIDGLERTHDLQRGARGSFRAAVETAERVAKSPMRLATNTQINRLSMPELVAMSDLLHELGSKAWQVQLTVPMGRAADRPELLLQPFDLLELFPLLAWIKREKLTPRGIRIFPGNNVGYFSHYEEQLRYGGDGGTHWASCGAGTSCMGIEADGAIKACPSLPTEQYTGGHSRERSVAEVLEQTEQLTHIGKRTRDDLWGFCNGCYYADVCKAGCTWTAQVLMGKPGNNPYCIHRQLEHERNGVHERLVKVEAAPGDPFDHGRFETVLEPIEETDDKPTILGVDIETVMNLTTQSRGIIDEAEGKHRLRIL